MSGYLINGVLEFIIGLTISENDVSAFDLGSVNWLIAESILDEVLPFANEIISSLWLDIPFSKGVCNLSIPGFTSNQFWVNITICDYVHLVPPLVVKVTEPLMM